MCYITPWGGYPRAWRLLRLEILLLSAGYTIGDKNIHGMHVTWAEKVAQRLKGAREKEQKKG